jgi:hypothetical protein
MNRNGCYSTNHADHRQIRHRMENLTNEDLVGLAAYAKRRLLRVGMDGCLAEDIAQDALQAILVGLGTPTDGRHPRSIDVASHSAFIDYIGGVINSLVSYERAKRIYQFLHEPIRTESDQEEDLAPAMELRSSVSVASEVSWNDFQHTFFTRLRPRAALAIQPILIDWQEVWQWSSQIPVPIPQRRLRRDVKRLAKEVLNELGEALAA